MHKSSNTKPENYHEATIQLRPDSEEILRFIYNQIKKRGNVFIAKEVELKTGRDIYLSDQHFAQSLGKKMKKSFKGKLMITRNLHGVNRLTSKKVYRVTVLFRGD